MDLSCKKLMDEYFARDIMKEDVITIEHSAAVTEAARKMAEREIVILVSLNKSPMSSSVSEVMSSPLISLSPDDSIWELAEEMKIRKIHKMPIVHENKVVGIVTTSDITRLCSIGSDSEMRLVCQQILQRLNQP